MTQDASEAVLIPLQADILYAIWKAREQDPPQIALTYRRIVEQVNIGEKKLTEQYIEQKTRAMLNCRPSLIVPGKSQPEQWPNRRGTKPTAFRLNCEEMITWPCSARLVITLLERRRDVAYRKNLFQLLLSFRLVHHTTGLILTEADYDEQLNYCMERGYVEEIAGKIPVLHATDRTNRELPFLKKIVEHVRTAPLLVKPTTAAN